MKWLFSRNRQTFNHLLENPDISAIFLAGDGQYKNNDLKKAFSNLNEEKAFTLQSTSAREFIFYEGGFKNESLKNAFNKIQGGLQSSFFTVQNLRDYLFHNNEFASDDISLIFFKLKGSIEQTSAQISFLTNRTTRKLFFNDQKSFRSNDLKNVFYSGSHPIKLADIKFQEFFFDENGKFRSSTIKKIFKDFNDSWITLINYPLLAEYVFSGGEFGSSDLKKIVKFKRAVLLNALVYEVSRHFFFDGQKKFRNSQVKKIFFSLTEVQAKLIQLNKLRELFFNEDRTFTNEVFQTIFEGLTDSQYELLRDDDVREQFIAEGAFVEGREDVFFDEGKSRGMAGLFSVFEDRVKSYGAGPPDTEEQRVNRFLERVTQAVAGYQQDAANPRVFEDAANFYRQLLAFRDDSRTAIDFNLFEQVLSGLSTLRQLSLIFVLNSLKLRHQEDIPHFDTQLRGVLNRIFDGNERLKKLALLVIRDESGDTSQSKSFGVEIEISSFARRMTFLAAIIGADATADTSIHGSAEQNEDEYTTVEIPSQIITSPEKFLKLLLFLHTLDSEGSYGANESTGTHVHLGTFLDEKTAAEAGDESRFADSYLPAADHQKKSVFEFLTIKAFCLLYYQVEPHLDGFLRSGASFNENVPYAKSAKAYVEGGEDVRETIRSAKSRSDIIDRGDSILKSRNSSINLKGKGRKTIEMRQAEGFDSPRKIEAWVNFNYQLRELAAELIVNLANNGFEREYHNLNASGMERGAIVEQLSQQEHLDETKYFEDSMMLIERFYHDWSSDDDHLERTDHSDVTFRQKDALFGNWSREWALESTDNLREYIARLEGEGLTKNEALEEMSRLIKVAQLQGVSNEFTPNRLSAHDIYRFFLEEHLEIAEWEHANALERFLRKRLTTRSVSTAVTDEALEAYDALSGFLSRKKAQYAADIQEYLEPHFKRLVNAFQQLTHQQEDEGNRVLLEKDDEKDLEPRRKKRRIKDELMEEV